MVLNNKKLTTKLDTNKHFSCISIFGDKVYMGNIFIYFDKIGTRNSKLYIYRIEG